MLYIFLGIQGSGKGTQAKIVCDELGLTHINLGELFRGHIKQNTAIGQEAQGYISQGLLVPDTVAFKVIDDALSQQVKGFVFDGFPRTINQAEFLTSKYPASKVIYLEVADEIALARMLARRCCNKCRCDYNMINNPPKVEGVCDKCGGEVITRADDTPELAAKRIELFHNETKPLREYYEKLGVLHTVNAARAIKDVHQDIIKVLNN